MKSLWFVAIAAIVFTASCGNEAPKEQSEKKENKDLLSTDLVTNPRSAAGTDTTALHSLATMDFRDTVYDFGTINEGEVVAHEYEFTNNGKSPLIISNAAGSCGCTVADFPREPVLAGKSAAITVKFSSANKYGHQEKSVTLRTNTARGTHILFIKGEVKETK